MVVVDSVGIVSAFYSLILARILHMVGQHSKLWNLATEPERPVQTYSLSLNRVNSSSPTLTGEPPN